MLALGTLLLLGAVPDVGGAPRAQGTTAAPAVPDPEDAPRIALVIDDVGYGRAAGLRVIDWPVPVTLAVLPHTPHGAALARAAHAAGKPVFVHLPMEPAVPGEPGPGALRADMGPEAFRSALERNLGAVPHAVGVNNHMGSRLTALPEPMDWLMAALRERHLAFLDSRTTPHTVAAGAARRAALPWSSRDVFLDPVIAVPAIEAQLERAAVLARRRGRAVVIGHPHRATLDVLEARITRGWFRREGLRLVPVTALMRGPASAPGASGPVRVQAGLAGSEVQAPLVEGATADGAE